MTAPFLALAFLLGHDLPHPKRDALVVREGSVELLTTFELPPGEEATMARKLFDRDSDGKLSAEEQRKLADWLSRTALLYAELSVDGRPLALPPAQLSPFGLDRPVGDSAGLGVEARVKIAAKLGDGKEHEVRLADRHKDRTVDVPTGASVEKPLTLVAAGAGKADLERGVVVDVLLKDEAPPLALKVRLAAKKAGR